jgi:hypothetical protein
MQGQLRLAKVVIGAGLLAGLFIVSASPVSAGTKTETIEAQAMGTGTQLGQNIGVTLNIYEYSTQADRQILVDAFNKGQGQGLSNALQKMKAVGHVEITGTLGYDCSFIKMTPTPTGRKIVFVTNRQIRFGEAFFDTQSQSFNLTAGILEINDQDKSKSTGTLYPLPNWCWISRANCNGISRRTPGNWSIYSTGRERLASIKAAFAFNKLSSINPD